jgi:hypothetical protein
MPSFQSLEHARARISSKPRPPAGVATNIGAFGAADCSELALRSSNLRDEGSFCRMMRPELHRHAAFLILPSWVHRSDEVSLRDRRARKNRMRARRGGAVGRGAWGERAPPDTNLPGGLEMTWPVLLSLKQSCVDLLIVMCQPQASHSRDASVCSTIEIKRGTAADQFGGCPSWRVDWADGQRQLPPTRFVSGKIEGRRNQRPTVSARAFWSSSGKSRRDFAQIR